MSVGLRTPLRDRAGAGLRAALLSVVVTAGGALVLLSSSAPAIADCTLTGSTVTCASTGGPQTTPVGTGAEDNLTVNIQAGATVDLSASPGAAAIDLNDFNVINNDGSVIGGAAGIGINVNNNSTIINRGSIAVDDGGTAINACCDTTIVNNGSITAGASGFGVFAADRTNLTNNSTITVGDNSAAVFVNSGNTIVNNGAIVAGDGGAGIAALDNNSIINAGSITVGNGFASFGIAAAFDNVVVNSGTITVGSGGTAIAAAPNTALPSFNTVTNSGTINLNATALGIIAADNHRVLNSGSINGGFGSIGIQGFNNNVVTNTGTINVGRFGSGVQFRFDGNVLNNSGTIRAIDGAFSIEGCACSSSNSAFNNLAGGTLDGYILVDGIGNSVTNSGLITITDPGTALIGYPTFVITNTTGGGAGSSFTQTAAGTLSMRMDNTGLIDNLSADAITPGGTVRIALQAQLYQNTTFSGTAIGLTPYGVFALNNTIASSFDRYVASSPFFTVTPIYDSGDPSNYAALSFQIDRASFGGVQGATPNQRAVGNALEAGYSAGLDPASAIGQFYINLLQAPSLSVLDQLSGAGTAAAQDAAFSSGVLFNGAMMQQALGWLNGTSGGNSVTVGGPSQYAATQKDKFAGRKGHDAFAAMSPAVSPQTGGRWRAWGLGYGARRTTDGQSGNAEQTVNAAGGAFGVDREIAPDFLFGFAAGGSSSRYSVDSLATNGHADAGHIGLYATKTFGAAYIAATLNYARANNSTERTIAGVGPTEFAKGSFDSDQFGGRLELGWKHRFAGYAVTPFIAIEPTVLRQQGYSESSTVAGGGAGMLGLTYQSNSVTSLPGFIGAQIDARYQLGNGQVLSPFARLSWMHEFESRRSIQASFIGIPGGGFTVDGARAAEDALRIDAGGTLSLGERASLFASVNSELSDRSRSIAGFAGLRVSW